MSGRLPLADAAMKLGLSYSQARNMLFRGELKGGRDKYGHLFVTNSEVRRLLAESRASSQGSRTY
jgi:hypothetical protein